MQLATVFEWHDFPSEIKHFYDLCYNLFVDPDDLYIEFPMDLTLEDLEVDYGLDDPEAIEAYFEMVTYLKANRLLDAMVLIR